MEKNQKIKRIKDIVDNQVNLSIKLPNIIHADSFNSPRAMHRVYRGVVDKKPTEFVFVETQSAISCIDIITDDAVNKLYDYLIENYTVNK